MGGEGFFLLQSLVTQYQVTERASWYSSTPLCIVFFCFLSMLYIVLLSCILIRLLGLLSCISTTEYITTTVAL